MNILSGLQAGTNFLTGIHTEELAKKQQDYINAMHGLALQNAQFNMDQKIQTHKEQQAESDAAMRLFNPSLASNTTATQGQPSNVPSNMSVPNRQVTNNTLGVPNTSMGEIPSTSQESIYKLQKLSNIDFSHGDVPGAIKLASTANAMIALADRNRGQNLASQEQSLRIQQRTYTIVAQHLGSSANKQEFERNKMWLLANVPMPPNERNNILGMQYSPELVQSISKGGMSAAEQAGLKLREIQNKNTQEHNKAMQLSYTIRANAAKARAAAYVKAEARNKKVGHIKRIPTKQDMMNADSTAQDIFFGKPGDNIITDQYKLFKDNLVSRALALMGSNANLTYTQALQETGQQMKQDGEISTTYGSPHFFTGTRDATTVFKPNESNVVPFTKDMKESDMVIGTYYRGQQGVRQWTKDGWGPIQ